MKIALSISLALYLKTAVCFYSYLLIYFHILSVISKIGNRQVHFNPGLDFDMEMYSLLLDHPSN